MGNFDRLNLWLLVLILDKNLPIGGYLGGILAEFSLDGQLLPKGVLFFDELRSFLLQLFLLFESMAMQEGQAEFEVLDLAVVSLLVVFEALVLFSELL